MKIVTLALCLVVGNLTGCGAQNKVETRAPSDLVKLLADANNEVRADAAASLRRLLAADPSARTNDHGEDYWQERAGRLKVGMKHSEVVKALPAYDKALSSDDIRLSGVGSGSSHFAMWRLDHYWTVLVHYRNPDTVIVLPELRRRAKHIWVRPPDAFTGRWLTWYVNGRKSHEIAYRNGKYHGPLIVFHDNGRKSHQQHYEKDVCTGSNSGWYSDGAKMYEGRHANGKQEGAWTHWSRDGTLRSRAAYKNGKLHGTSTRWREDGKKRSEVSYRNGAKHGIDVDWDKSGKVLWSRHFDNGKLIRSDAIE